MVAVRAAEYVRRMTPVHEDAVQAAVAFGSLSTVVGTIGVLSGPEGIRRVGWGMERGTVAETPDATVQAAVDQITDYLSGRRQEFDLPLDLATLQGSTRTVLLTLWETVGYGETITYGDLAARSGSGVPARGIGSIMGANPIPLIIPCHRVVAHDGLGGYSGGDRGHGLETKRWLLELEGALPPMLPL